MSKNIAAALAVVGLVLSGAAQASLVDRGGGMLYDNVLNITWLQDANYARTSGFSPTGLMDWETATNWVQNLSYSGITGWRLPSANLISGCDLSCFSWNGTTDFGWNNTRGELGFMFYVNLMNTPAYGTSGENLQNGINNIGFLNVSFVDPASGRLVSLIDVDENVNYWYQESHTYSSPDDTAWILTFGGGQFIGNKITHAPFTTAWAVHDGDVAVNLAFIPEPGSAS